MSPENTAIEVVNPEFVPALKLVNNVPMVNSKDIARGFGKLHKNVIRSIETVITDPESDSDFNRLNFEPVDFIDAKGETRKSYDMTKDGFSFIVMGFTGSKASKFKIGYIKAFNKMEGIIKQGVNPELIENMAKLLEVVSKSISSLEERMGKYELNADLRSVKASNPVISDNSNVSSPIPENSQVTQEIFDSTYSNTYVAELLNITIPALQKFLLRRLGIIVRCKGGGIELHESFKDKGIAVDFKTNYDGYIRNTLRWTEKGVGFISSQYRKI